MAGLGAKSLILSVSSWLVPNNPFRKRHMHPTTPSLKDQVHPDEWQLRVALAACYRLSALYGWTDLVFTHISAKLPTSVSGSTHEFLINP